LKSISSRSLARPPQEEEVVKEVVRTLDLVEETTIEVEAEDLAEVSKPSD